MRCRILKPLKADGEKELNPGDIVDVPKDLAIKYIQKGKIETVEKIAYRIYSNILSGYLWVVDTDEDMHTLRASQDVSEAIYTADEIKELKGCSKDSLRELHKIKETFPQSSIKEIKRNEQNIQH